MSVVLPDGHHLQKELEKKHIICVPPGNKSYFRPLRIGILNIMPEAKNYEFYLLSPLGKSLLQVVPVWIKLESHFYKSTQKSYLDKYYVTYEQACKTKDLDGMILTGAPVERIEFSEVAYWTEIKHIIGSCRKKGTSVLGLCWGAMALAYILGIKKQLYVKKMFDVYQTINLQRNHPVTGLLGDIFWMPHSRYAGFSNEELEKAQADGVVNLLAKTKDMDYTILESTDRKFLMNLGHFEYGVGRIIEEFLRDKNKQDIALPKNFNLEKPINLWRSQRNVFYNQWLNLCCEELIKNN